MIGNDLCREKTNFALDNLLIMKKRPLFLRISLIYLASVVFPLSIWAQSAKVLTQTHMELQSAWQGEVDQLAKEHAEVFLGRGSREANLLQMVQIDYGQDKEVMVLMLYHVVIEHARGGDEMYAALVWSETQKMFIQKEKDLGYTEGMGFHHLEGDWGVMERRSQHSDPLVTDYLWYNLQTREVRFGNASDKLPPPATLKFVTKNDGASDIWWELVDEKEQTLPLTNAIRAEIAEVRHVVPAMLDNNRYAVWFLGEKLRCLDIEKNTVSTLMTLYADTDGLSGLEIAPGDGTTRIAFANLNPNRYEHHSKIFVLDIEDGKLIKKQKFDADLHYGVKGNSPYHLIIEGEDFWFNDRNEIQYRENPMTTDPRMGFGEWDMTTYPFKIQTIVLE